jgi:hypothetical protein
LVYNIQGLLGILFEIAVFFKDPTINPGDQDISKILKSVDTLYNM